MPYLTLQISPGGPVVDVLVGVSQARREALQRASAPVPNPIQIRALIDTGASCTCIDPAVLQRLGLSPTGTTAMHTPSTGNQAHLASQYDVSLVLLHQLLTFTIHAVPVVEAQLQIQGIQALIGAIIYLTRPCKRGSIRIGLAEVCDELRGIGPVYQGTPFQGKLLRYDCDLSG